MEKLKKVMADIFKMQEGQITDEQAIHNTAAWDSLKHIELIVAIEESFGLKLTVDEIVSMVSMKAIKDVLKNKGVGA